MNLGEQLDVGKGIVSLQSLSPVFVDFSLPQDQFAKLQTGLKVRAVLDAYPTNQFEGEIAAINPDLDVTTRSVRVRAKFANEGELLRAGMFVRASPSCRSAGKPGAGDTGHGHFERAVWRLRF